MEKAALRRMFTAVLACVLLACCVPADTAQAAVNKALAVPYSFENLTWNKDGDKAGKNNGYPILLPGTEKQVSVKGIKMGAVVYMPKKALKKKGSSINFEFHLSLERKGKFVGYTRPGVTLVMHNDKGKVKMLAWHEQKQKEVKASTYASFKGGKGKYKDYYVITLKNLPLHGAMTPPGSEVGDIDAEKKINMNVKYTFSVDLIITGQAAKASGTFYLDQLTVTSGSKKVVNHTFSKKPKWYEVWNRDKKMSAKKVKIVKL